MGIKSTQDVTRQQAIDRINQIQQLAADKNYSKIADESFEDDTSPKSFVDSFTGVVDVSKWTNGMLEELLDQPFYRWSYFANYNVVDKLPSPN